MGLDQYAFKVNKSEFNNDFDYEDIDEDGEETVQQLAYWRKHPNLEGWMEQLFNRKADAQGFVGKVEFNNTVVATVMGEISKENMTPELEAMSGDESEMQAKIQKEKIAANSANYGKTRMFNQQPIRLTITDLDQLEMHIKMNNLPATNGFFFGEDSDDHYRNDDLKFIENARQAINEGYDVYYRSWW